MKIIGVEFNMLCLVHFEDYIDIRYKETLDYQIDITRNTTKSVAYNVYIPSETNGIKLKFNITGYEFLLHRHDIRNTNYIINKFKENEEYKDLLNSVLEKYPKRKYNLQYFVLDISYLYDKELR